MSQITFTPDDDGIHYCSECWDAFDQGITRLELQRRAWLKSEFKRRWYVRRARLAQRKAEEMECAKREWAPQLPPQCQGSFHSRREIRVLLRDVTVGRCNFGPSEMTFRRTTISVRCTETSGGYTELDIMVKDISAVSYSRSERQLVLRVPLSALGGRCLRMAGSETAFLLGLGSEREILEGRRCGQCPSCSKGQAWRDARASMYDPPQIVLAFDGTWQFWSYLHWMVALLRAGKASIALPNCLDTVEATGDHEPSNCTDGEETLSEDDWEEQIASHRHKNAEFV